MADKTQFKDLGVDTAKDWLDIFDGAKVTRIANTSTAIKSFLKQLSAPVSIAIESTGYYHELFLELAFEAGHTIYLVNAYRLSRYRDAMGVRIKTDAEDANLLHRYLQSEKSHLVPFSNYPKAVKSMNRLLKARAKLAKVKSMVALSLDHIEELKTERDSLIEKLDESMASIEQRIVSLIKEAGYLKDYQRCLSIPGVGTLNAANLVAIYHRGNFRRADAFISFMGLDVRVRESGYYKGKRRLTKRGDPETRRLLFNAARSASRTSTWNACYQSLTQRGLSTTAAAVALSRKIARVAFALMRDQSQFCKQSEKTA